MEANKVRKMKKRICLVLDCLCAHDFSDKTADLINLQHYVIKEKRLSEREAIVIFYDVVRVVEALHKVGVRRVSVACADADVFFSGLSNTAEVCFVMFPIQAYFLITHCSA